MSTFDFNNFKRSADFDEHINSSIPNYSLLVESAKSIAEYFYSENAVIFDLGCSTGEMLRSIDTKCKKRGVDYSTLLPKADERFENIDLNKNDVVVNACVVFSLFTMQFLHTTRRRAFIEGIRKGLIDGGALIIAEKVYQQNGRAQEILTFSHYEQKRKSFSSDDILDKEKALRQVMKPMNESDLESMLRESGFSVVTSFWQSFNFKAYLCIK